MWKKELIKNKIWAICILLLGIATICIDNDATVFVLLLPIGMTLFFARENWVN